MRNSGPRKELGSPQDQFVAKELVGIQYLRGVAALLVVVHHLSTSGDLVYLGLPRLGAFGVDIFFVISGFIMWHTTAARDISTIGFWRRRFIRIVPLYWISLSAMVIVAQSMPQNLKSTIITPETTVKSFLFIPHFHAVQNIIAPILVPGWSLNYEMFFYLLFGLALLVSTRWLRASLVGASLWGLVILGVLLHPTGAVMETYTNFRLLEFFNGMVLAIMYRSALLVGPVSGLALLAGGVLALYGSGWEEFDACASFIGLSPTLIVAGGLALETVVRRTPNTLFHTIGNASYSIYLGHLFFLRVAELVWGHFMHFDSSKALDLTYFAVSTAFAIAGGIAMHHFVESPMLLLLQRWRISPKVA